MFRVHFFLVSVSGVFDGGCLMDWFLREWSTPHHEKEGESGVDSRLNLAQPAFCGTEAISGETVEWNGRLKPCCSNQSR